MVAHSYKQVKEQTAALLHFVLHGGAFLEVVTAADDESEIVSSQR